MIFFTTKIKILVIFFSLDSSQVSRKAAASTNMASHKVEADIHTPDVSASTTITGQSVARLESGVPVVSVDKETEATTIFKLTMLANQIVSDTTCGDGYAFMSKDGRTIESVYTCQNRMPDHVTRRENDCCARCTKFCRDQNVIYNSLPDVARIRQAWRQARVPVMLKWAMDNLHATSISPSASSEIRVYTTSQMMASRRYIGHFIDIVE